MPGANDCASACSAPVGDSSIDTLSPCVAAFAHPNAMAGGALDGISLQVQKITEMSVQIAAAVEEQSVVSEDINRNIAGIRSACEVTVDAGQQSHRHSGDVADLAASLRSLAQEFWQTRR